MADRKPQFDSNEPPEDVASLYSWANLHGAKYRDFSASRALNREKTRSRLEQEVEQERQLVVQSSEAVRAAEAQRAADEARRAAEDARQAEVSAQQAAASAQRLVEEQARHAEAAARQAAQDRARLLAEESSQRTAEQRARLAADEAAAAQRLAETMARSSELPIPNTQPAHPTGAWIPPGVDRGASPAASPYRPVFPNAPMREAVAGAASSNPAQIQDSRQVASRPAWLEQRPEQVASAPVAQPLEDTIQGSRERITSRWFALKGVFEGASAVAAPPVTAVASSSSRVPVLAVFSLAGGVGKTSLAATLGRALSSRGERVLLVETAPFGLLPFFFGAHDQRYGHVRTFTPPTTSGDAPIQTVAFDPGALGAETATEETLEAGISRYSLGASRVIVDIATASATITRRVMKLNPRVLVPIMPDLNSVMSVASIDAFFENYSGSLGKFPYYVLNQFDPSLPLHLDVREVLREQLGDRLLTFALRRSPAISEALAEGMTVMDYAPGSAVTEDFGSLAGWVKNVMAPASASFRGLRWSEQ